MSIDERTLQVEITILPAKGRRSGERREPAAVAVPEPQAIPRLTRLLALAIKFETMVERGEVRDYADLARLGYVTRARLTQIMNLLLLAPEIQETLLHPEQVPSGIKERHLRRIVASPDWAGQRASWINLQRPSHNPDPPQNLPVNRIASTPSRTFEGIH